jgi:non-ribosomal peptide synthetase component F
MEPYATGMPPSHEMYVSTRIHEQFQRVAAALPNAPAVIAGSSVTTYGELEEQSTTLAKSLLARGVIEQEAIGVLGDRSPNLHATFLAILKAGAIYVPLSASLPPQRLVSRCREIGAHR